MTTPPAPYPPSGPYGPPAAYGPPPAARRRHPVAITVAAVVAGLTLLFGVYGLVGLVMRQDRTLTPAVNGDITAARVDVAGVVTVSAGPAPSVTLTEHWAFRPPSVTTVVAGGGLAVAGSCRPPLQIYCSVDAAVVVPATTGVDAHSSGGGITVTGVSGPVSAASSGGSVRLASLSGPVSADSSGGGITGTDLGPGSVQAQSSGGGVTLRFASPPASVDARSSGGAVTVVLPNDATAYRVDAQSSGGRTTVDVRTDPASSHVVYVRSSGGGVTVRYG